MCCIHAGSFGRGGEGRSPVAECYPMDTRLSENDLKRLVKAEFAKRQATSRPAHRQGNKAMRNFENVLCPTRTGHTQKGLPTGVLGLFGRSKTRLRPTMLLAERTIVHQVLFHELPSILIPKQWICHALVDEDVHARFRWRGP